MPKKGGYSEFDFVLAMEDLFRLKHFVEIAMQGFDRALHGTDWVELMKQVRAAVRFPDVPIEIHEQRIKDAQEKERIAKEEVDERFSALYAMATAHLWTILESNVDNVVGHVLETRPESRSFPSIRKLKGPLIEFTSLSNDEQIEFIIDRLKEDIGFHRHPGAGRFEALLNAVSLGGSVSHLVSKTLLECSEIRHVLIHRRGKADQKLLQQCEWLPFAAGEVVRVSPARFNSFLQAGYSYLLEIGNRLHGNVSPIALEFRMTFEANLASSREEADKESKA
jgi:hypothetical protein